MTYQTQRNHQVQPKYDFTDFDEQNIYCYLRTDDWQNVLELILNIQYKILQIENYDFGSLEARGLKNVKDTCILLLTLNDYNKNQKFYFGKLNPQYEYSEENKEKISKLNIFIRKGNIVFSKYELLNLFEDLKEEAYHIRYQESQYSKEMFSNAFIAIAKNNFKEKNRMTKWYWKIVYYIRDFFLKKFNKNQQAI